MTAARVTRPPQILAKGRSRRIVDARGERMGAAATLVRMTDTITFTGTVGTQPRHSITSGGVPMTTFRLASTYRRFDRESNKWVDGDTNWYGVTAFRQLALNAATSIHTGERVVVTGRLRLREWQTADKSGTNVDVEADALGHDLAWGSANWVRSSHPSTPPAPESFAEPAGSDPEDRSTDAAYVSVGGGNSQEADDSSADRDGLGTPF